MEYRYLTVRVPASMHSSLHKVADENMMAFAAVVRLALSRFLHDYERGLVTLGPQPASGVVVGSKGKRRRK